MYVLDINPVAFGVGGFEMRWYSLFLAVGLTGSFFYLRSKLARLQSCRHAANHGIASSPRSAGGLTMTTGSSPDKAALFLLGSILAGARFFYFVFYAPSRFSELFHVWQGGLSFHGGLIGAVVAVLFLSRKHGFSYRELFDKITIPGIFFLMLGRLGNLINGTMAGTPFSGAWCAVFPKVDNICRHPYPLYAFLSHFVLLVSLLFLRRYKKNADWLSAVFLIGYGILRILTDIWKEEGAGLGLKTGQWLSVLMVLVGFILFLRYHKHYETYQNIRKSRP